MKIIFFAVLVAALSGCETTKYPLHEVLNNEFEKVAQTHHQFLKITSDTMTSDSTILSADEFRQEYKKFLKEFPDVTEMKGSVENQNHKYQGKRKFIRYNLDAEKDEEAEVMITFYVKDDGNDVMGHASYMRMRESERPNPSIHLVAEMVSSKIKYRKGNVYWVVEWK